MKKFYLIIGMDKLSGFIFYPGTCLFKTRREAVKYIELNENENTKYCFRLVYQGKIK